jgi:hypothetical protein
MNNRGRVGRQNKYKNNAETKIVRDIEELAEFQAFKDSILPKLQKMLKSGAGDQEILDWAKSFAAARLASIVLAEPDSGRALAAVKDLLDRTRGKAKEVKELTHRMSALPDTDLNALLVSELAALEGMSGDTTEEDDDENEV